MSCYEVHERKKGQTHRVTPHYTGTVLMKKIFEGREPRARAAPKPPKKPLLRFRICGVEVEAASKSEARALVKARLGLDKLPAGTKAQRIVADTAKG